MTEELPTRDLIAALLYLAAAIVALCAFDPFKWWLLLVTCAVLTIAYVVALRKFAAMGGGLGALSIRALVLFFAGKGLKMLFLGLASAALVYAIFKLDPESSAP
jgi:hypothetical protein